MLTGVRCRCCGVGRWAGIGGEVGKRSAGCAAMFGGATHDCVASNLIATKFVGKYNKDKRITLQLRSTLFLAHIYFPKLSSKSPVREACTLLLRDPGWERCA